MVKIELDQAEFNVLKNTIRIRLVKIRNKSYHESIYKTEFEYLTKIIRKLEE